VHIGDVVQRENNVLGDSVNIAARIEPLAKPGGICVTQQVFDQVHNKLEAPLIKLGTPELKNIQMPICLYRVVMPWEAKELDLRERTRFQSPGKPRRWAVTAVVALVLAGIALSVWRQPTHGQIALAVLPLANLSNDPAQEYFADGITDLLTTELGKISSLRVSSFQAVKDYKKEKVSLAKMASYLKVDAWVEGSILHDGSRATITARLIQASTAMMSLHFSDRQQRKLPPSARHRRWLIC
jgi:adenylate cyclase